MNKTISILGALLATLLPSCQSLDLPGATRDEKTRALATHLPEWKPSTLVNQFGRTRSVQLFNNLILDADNRRLDASSTGQASLLTPDGYALTATHVLNDGPVSILRTKIPNAGRLALTNAGPVWFSPDEPERPRRIPYAELETQPIRVIKRFRGTDLTLVKLPVKSPAWFSLAPHPPAENSTLFAYGSNLSGNSSAGKVLKVNHRQSSPWILTTTVPLQKGDSGGPVMDPNGNLVGIISRGNAHLFTNELATTVAVGVSPNELRKLIDDDRNTP